MNTCSAAPATPLDPAPAEVGSGRYLLDGGKRAGALRTGLDTRLGRRVLVQCGTRATPSAKVATRLVRIEHPGLGPLLDAGDDPRADGATTAWTVFPATDWPSLADAAPDWAALDVRDVARVAAWVIATVVTVQQVVGPTVAPRSGDVVVDPAVFDGTDDADACPVRWLPALAATDGDLAATLAGLADRRSRRERRRLTDVLGLAATPAGRPRAARVLAATAGLDLRRLGLLAHAPHHAERIPRRRPAGRRSLVGIVPTTKRTELACESVEAFS